MLRTAAALASAALVIVGPAALILHAADATTRPLTPPPAPAATAPAPHGWQPFRDVEGHHGCRILVGPTSHVRCADGFEATS